MNMDDYELIARKFREYETQVRAEMTAEELALYDREPVPVTAVDPDVLAAAVDFLETENAARQWLGTPLAYFRGKTPAEVAAEDAKLVIDFALGLSWGNYM